MKSSVYYSRKIRQNIILLLHFAYLYSLLAHKSVQTVISIFSCSMEVQYVPRK
jgi:hypothetical protein